ncbi:hypothetical protein [Acinetobacter bereziniae]|uniref:hypothetical protein n=1 Tax=Acinetobacter bereziniae TaxID=106648 RepID=UPI003016329C
MNSHIYADRYVFGGKAQFIGALISQGCSISIENPSLSTSQSLCDPIQIQFSSCPVYIYDHLTIGLSKQNKQTKEIFFTNSQAKNDFDKEISIQGFGYISLGQKLIDHVDQATQDQNSAKKKINIFLKKPLDISAPQAQHILVSIFYP